MLEKETIELIARQTISLPNNGTDSFPGFFLRLDSEQISKDGKILDIYIEAWYDYKDGVKYQRNVNNFIITYGYHSIIVDYFFEAKAVWDYFLKTYPT